MAAFTLTQSEEDLSIFLVVGPDGRPVSTINAFLLHLSHCGRSAYTLRSYARGLAHFFGWLHTTGRQVDDVTPQAVEAYIALFSTETKGGACPVDPHKAGQINLRTRKSAPSVHRQPRTVNHQLSVLASFFAYCIQQDTERGSGRWIHRANPVPASPSDNTNAHGMPGRDAPRRGKPAELRRRVPRRLPRQVDPLCDRWDYHEQLPLPRAPYLLQGAGHPSCITAATIRTRLHHLSTKAGAQTAQGLPLVLRPHDCRRVFASEHLNNNTPVHVIQALLGHTTLDTMMVYAKLYPTHLVDEYRKALHGVYRAVHGEDSFRNPTAEEWAAFAASCSLRDMGTHVCALPTGEYCLKGLVCLGCVHAQPKKSAAPIFRRMLASHERALAAASKRGEPAGQIAAREMEVARLRQALCRAEELTMDVAAAIEEMAEGVVAE